MAILLYITTGFVLFVLYFLLRAWKVNQHWANLNIPHPKPVLVFGNLLDLVLRRRTQGEIIRDIYNSFPNEPIVGYYHFQSPRLIVRDQNLYEKVLIRDFQHFVDRSMAFTVKGNPLVLNLFVLSGNAWRALRSKLSPMFTTGKLKYMFPQVRNIADDLISCLQTTSEKVDLKEEISKFTMEVICSSAFGIEPGTLGGEESEFRKEAKIALGSSFSTFAQRLVLFSFPRLAGWLKFGFMPERSQQFFTNVVRDALTSRKSTKMVRNDFIQLMVTLLEKGYIEIEKEDRNDDYMNLIESDDESVKAELNVDVMVGHAFVFLLAGFETTATAMASMCMELAANPEAQELARNEVNKFFDLHEEFTYDKAREMHYLEGCMKEGLRLHPPVGHILRTCVKRYHFPGTNLTIDPGQYVVVPGLGIQTSPEFFPEPDKFLPERWSPEVSHLPCTFLPFGDGPRMCIGMRFAMMEIKCALAKILRNYKLSLHPSVKLPVKVDPYSFFGSPMKPVLFNVEKITSL